jgi:uncharacterized protein involved in outer membrane biogenesis
MKKIAIILGIGLLVILVGLGVLYYGIKSYLTPEKVSALISEKLESAIHHKVKLGPITTGFSSADIGGLTLLPNRSREPVPLVKIRHVSLTFSLIPLLHRRLEIGVIRIDAPEVHMVRFKNGRLNWQKEFSRISLPQNVTSPRSFVGSFSLVPKAMAADTKPRHKGFVIQIGKIEIHEGTLNWEDRTRTPTYKATLAPLEIELKRFSLDAPFDFHVKGTLQRKKKSRFEALGTLNLKKKDVKGTLGFTSLYLPDISPYLDDLGLKVLAGMGTLRLQCSTQGFENWTIDPKLGLTDVILQVRGRQSPKITAKLLASAKLDLRKEGQLILKSFEGKILGSDITITGKINHLKTVPRGTLRVTSNKMDGDTLMGLAAVFSSPPEKKEKKDSKVPVLSAPRRKPPAAIGKGQKKAMVLPSLTIHATLHLLTVRKIRIEAIDTRIITHGTLVVMDPFTAKIYGGTVHGKFRMDLSQGLPSFKKEMSIKNVAVGSFLSDLRPGGKERFTGRFFGNIRGEGTLGLPSTYKGKATFRIEHGEVQHVAILRMAAALMKLPSLAHLRFNELRSVIDVKDRRVHVVTADAKGKDLFFHLGGVIRFDQSLHLKARLELPYRVVRKGLGKRSDLFADRTDQKDRRWSIIPFKIRGTTDHPRISVVFEKKAIEKILEKNIHDKKIRNLLKKLF